MRKIVGVLLAAMAALSASATDGWINVDGKHHIQGKSYNEKDLEFKTVFVVRLRDDCGPSTRAAGMVAEIKKQYPDLPILVTELTGSTRHIKKVVDSDISLYSCADVEFAPAVHTNDLYAAEVEKIKGSLKGCRYHKGLPDPYIVGPSGCVSWKGNGGYVPATVEAELKKAQALNTPEGFEGDFITAANEHPAFVLRKLERLQKQQKTKMTPKLVKLYNDLKSDKSCVQLAKIMEEREKMTFSQWRQLANVHKFQIKVAALRKTATGAVLEEAKFFEEQFTE